MRSLTERSSASEIRVTLQRLGRNRRLVLRFEWLTLWPVCAVLPVRSHRRDMGNPQSLCARVAGIGWNLTLLGGCGPYSDRPIMRQGTPTGTPMETPTGTPYTLATDAGSARDTKVITLVSAAHFVSHYYILLLPPLFPLVRAEFGVTYVELGAALAAFNVIAAAMQTPAGFLVDRVSARAVLVGGLVLGAGAFGIASLLSSFWAFVAMFA